MTADHGHPGSTRSRCSRRGGPPKSAFFRGLGQEVIPCGGLPSAVFPRWAHPEDAGSQTCKATAETNRLGVLVDRADPAALAAGLQAVLADDAGRRRVAEEGPAAVRDAFSVARVGEQLVEMYKSVLSTASSHDGCGD